MPASAPALRPEASGPAAANINPATGLSTDYLNHFAEALMALEMLRDVPECVDDLQAWRPKTYAEHFAGSGLRRRDAIIRAYDVAPLRPALDALAGVINRALARARDDAVRQAQSGLLDFVPERAAGQIRPLIAKLADLINGSGDAPSPQEHSQAAIDAMFAK